MWNIMSTTTLVALFALRSGSWESHAVCMKNGQLSKRYAQLPRTILNMDLIIFRPNGIRVDPVVEAKNYDVNYSYQ